MPSDNMRIGEGIVITKGWRQYGMNVHSACTLVCLVYDFRKRARDDFGMNGALQQKSLPRDRIIWAARQLFSEKGFHRTAMADLAGQAQVSVGAIYRSFHSKAAIIRAIVEADTQDTLERMRNDIDRVRDGSISGEAAIQDLVFEWVSKRSDALNHEIVAEAHRNLEVAEVVTAICSQFREMFRALARSLSADLSETQIEGIAELLLACLFGMGNREFTQPRLDELQTAQVVTSMLLHCFKAGG